MEFIELVKRTAYNFLLGGSPLKQKMCGERKPVSDWSTDSNKASGDC